MSKSRAAFASLAALTAAFSLSACGGKVNNATDQTGSTVTGATNTLGGYAINEINSPHQPNAVIVAFDDYKGGGVAIVSTVGAEPAPARVLRKYSVGGNSFMEFTPAADRNTVCTLIDGYESGGLACARVNPAPATTLRAPGA